MININYYIFSIGVNISASVSQNREIWFGPGH